MSKIKLGNVLFNVLAIVTVIAAVFVAVNFFSGAKGYAVTSDSMKDTLNRGDAVFSRPVKFEELQVGDIVTVDVDGEGFFTHRIVEIDAENRTVSTKGDANPSVDPMPAAAEQICGRMWYSVPLVGYFSIAFSSVSQVKGLIILAVAAAVLIAVNMILSKKRRGDSNE